MTEDIRAHLSSETVAELKPAQGLRVSRTATVGEVLALMQQNRTGCVLVCEDDKLQGIFTEQDYLRRVLGEGRSLQTPLSDCMTPDPVTVCSSESVATLIARIDAGRYRRMPVVDKSGRLVGCVSIGNLMHHLAEHHHAAVYKLSPMSKPMQQNREGA